MSWNVPLSHGALGSHGTSQQSQVWNMPLVPLVHPIQLSHDTLGSHGMSHQSQQ